ncbi:copper transporter [Coprinopsis sp. MPI-PUGE-AT-0042]|nr:copper transporter [Coprinopsis sp. MPI-PUGE-AT-0042]
MVPYFHSTPGDHLFLKAWVPKTPGAIAGACIGLFLLGMLDRWLSAMRHSFELHWKHRAMILSSRYSTNSQELSRSSTPNEKAPATVVAEEASTSRIPSLVPKLRPRTIPPFVVSHDIPRGILHAFQSAIGFLLMLATMSYRIEWIVSILIGLGLGETLFGRYGSNSVH